MKNTKQRHKTRKNGYRTCEASVYNFTLHKYETQKAYFHEWSIECEELQDGIGQYPVAIVELQDGTVYTVETNKIKFIDR